MKCIVKKLSTILIIIGAFHAHAALPPSHANLRDLDTMILFIKEHQYIASTLEQIDVKALSVLFDNGCVALFERKSRFFTLPSAGPQPGITFKESNCSLTDHNKRDIQ